MAFIKLLFFALFLSIIKPGGTQTSCTHPRGRFSSDGDLFLNLNHPDQVCIRCLFDGVLQNGTIYIVVASGITLNDSLPDVTINADGSMILDNPGNYLSDTDTFTCNSGSTLIITARQMLFFDPVINPDGGDDGTIDIVEGSELTVSCTGNPGNTGTGSFATTYQWFDSAGNPVTASTPFPPNNFVLTAISRNNSGDYQCRYTLTSSSEITRSNVTIDVQYPPNILSITPENMTLIQANSLTFNCTFDANPPVNNINWTLNGALLDPETDPNLNLMIEKTFSLLEVTVADINYNGVYRCVVDNDINPPDESEAGRITVQVAPDPVSDLKSDIAENYVRLNWSLEFDGNAAITGINIIFEATNNNATPHMGSVLLSGQPTSTVITGLQPFTEYRFSVTVLNSVSDVVGSSIEKNVTAITEPLVPKMPIILSLTPVNATALNVTWMADNDPFTQTAIESFTIEYFIYGNSLSRSAVTIDDPNTRTIVITGLMKGTTYGVRIQTSNSAGPSNYSTPVTQRTDIDVPSTVQDLTLTTYTFSVCVSWSVPLDNGGQNISSYKIELWNMEKYTLENYIPLTTVGSNILIFSIEDLKQDTIYSIRVAASNENSGEGGLGPYDSRTTTTGEPIPEDTDIVVSVDTEELTPFTAPISWTLTSSNIEFRLQYKRINGGCDTDPYTYSLNFSGDVTSGELTGLQANTTYEIRLIRIEQNSCIRKTSPTITFSTFAIGTVSAPTGLSVISVTSFGVTLVWFSTPDGSIQPYQYTVYISNDDCNSQPTISTVQSTGSTTQLSLPNDLEPGVNYTVHVIAVGMDSGVNLTSDPSNSVNFTTQTTNPVFSSSTLSVLSSDSLFISWIFTHTGGLSLLSVSVVCESDNRDIISVNLPDTTLTAILIRDVSTNGSYHCIINANNSEGMDSINTNTVTIIKPPMTTSNTEEVSSGVKGTVVTAIVIPLCLISSLLTAIITIAVIYLYGKWKRPHKDTSIYEDMQLNVAYVKRSGTNFANPQICNSDLPTLPPHNQTLSSNESEYEKLPNVEGIEKGEGEEKREKEKEEEDDMYI